MMTAKHILKQIGRDAVGKRLNVGKSVISRAAIENEFPASWYIGLTALGEERGVEVPRELFKWREPNEAAE